jgi:hypothetical protein
MSRKKHVNIAGKQYTIHRSNLDSVQAWGLCDAANTSIHISETLEETTKLPPEVIELHEILHAILFETGLSALLEDQIEESLVQGLALQLYNTGYRRTTRSKPLR